VYRDDTNFDILSKDDIIVLYKKGKIKWMTVYQKKFETEYL